MKKILFSMLALFAIATTVGAQVEINDTNFPDENFRAYVKKNFDTDENNILSKDEINAVTEVRCPAVKILNLKGIEHFTKLVHLSCNYTGLTELDVSKNTALESLNCINNKLTALDVSKNTALTNLDCQNNNLTALDVSKNTALKNLNCSHNKLTELDVSKNMNLTYLYCHFSKIKGAKMLALVNSLPTVSGSEKGKFFVIDTEYPSIEGNVITKPQVAIAKNKNWIVYDYRSNGKHIEYEGSVPEGIAIDATNFPDANFRSFVSGTTIDKDGNSYLNDEEIAAVKTLDVSKKRISKLNGIGFFTALEMLLCQTNSLTALDLSANKNLKALACYGNWIKDDKMQALVNSLPEVPKRDASGKVQFGALVVIDSSLGGGILGEGRDQNAITKEQVAIAKDKNWKVFDNNGGSPKEYAGSGGTTGLTAVESGQWTVDSWYSIDGVKLQGEPTKKGVYIVNGKKIVK